MIEDFQTLKNRANAEFCAGHSEKAIDLYTQALAETLSDEERATLYANRAASRLHLKDHRGALEDSDEALKLNPLHVKSRFRRATALQALGDNSAALAAAQAAQQLEPGNAQIKRLVQKLDVEASVNSDNVIPRNLLPPLFRCSPFEVVPSTDGILKENLLLLFHGLGDTPASYARFAHTIQLPQTTAVSLGAPHEVPFSDGGRSWFTVFDESMELIPATPGEKRRIQSLDTTIKALMVLVDTLEERGWPRRRVHLFGFSQGGTVAMQVARRCSEAARPVASCVAVASGMLGEELMVPPQAVNGSNSTSTTATPMLLLHGDADTVVVPSRVNATVKFLEAKRHSVEFHSISGKGHSMIGSENESRLLMEFWAKHLSSRPVDGPDYDILEIAPGVAGIQIVEGEEVA